MELKKVSNQINKNYAKKEQVTKKDLRKSVPQKWIVAASAGLVTLFFKTSEKSIYQIGVVFGCIEIKEDYNYSSLFNTLNGIMDFFYYATIVVLISSFISIFIGFLTKDPEKQKKIANVSKFLCIAFIVLLIITAVLVVVLKMDISAFYEGGVKKVVN